MPASTAIACFSPSRKGRPDAHRRLVSAEGVIAEDEAAVLRALVAFEAGPADFSDYLILDTARRAEALPLWTFDPSPRDVGRRGRNSRHGEKGPGLPPSRGAIS